MKFFRISMLVGMLSCAVLNIVQPGINFGNKRSGFIVTTGVLDVSGTPLVGGTLRVPNSGGLSTASAMDCTRVTIERTDGDFNEIIVDGNVKLTGGDLGITLGDNDKLCVQGGTVVYGVTAAGSTSAPSILEGWGHVSTLSVAASKKLILRWHGDLESGINAGGAAPTFMLDQDLVLAPGAGFGASGFFTSTVLFNGYKLFMGGSAATPAVVNNGQVWSRANVVMTGDVTVAANTTITLSSADGVINGNGNRLTFNTGSVFDNNGYGLTFENIILSGVTSGNFTASGEYIFSNATFETDGNSLTLDGVCASGALAIFGSGAGSTTFGASTITLNANCSLLGTWNFDDACCVNGKGYYLDVNDGVLALGASTLTMIDTVLAGLVSASIDASDGQVLAFTNVTLLPDDNGAMRVHGFAGESSSALVTLSELATAGDMYGNDIEWRDAAIELLNDVTLSSTWSFATDSLIDGGGNHFNLESGTLSIASGHTLHLCNIVLDNVNNDSIDDFVARTPASGRINLSDVIIKLSGNVDWSEFNTYFIISGPVTFVTGAYTFKTWSSGASGSHIDGVTAFYDTLNEFDNDNVLGFGAFNGGRLMFIESLDSGDITVTAGTTYVRHDQFLSATIDDVPGRTITFSGEVIYEGLGRTLWFPSSDDIVFLVSDDSMVKTRNLVFEGLLPEHLDISATPDHEGALYFCDGTVIRLTQNWALAQTITFGFGSLSDTMVLDLNGHSIDMGAAEALIQLKGNGALLIIKNGTLTNVSGSKIAAEQDTTIQFQNVEIELSDDYTFADASLIFSGRCVLSGATGASLINGSGCIIGATSHLIIRDGITYYHNNEGTDNFVMTNATSCLELIGGTFKRKSTTTDDLLLLTDGTLIVDHKSLIDLGSKGIIFGGGPGHQLSIVVRPNATINVVGTGALLYQV